jgi:SAM-dependent methyltransferase
MSFSPEWNTAFKNRTHLSKWPWSDLVGYVMRYAQPMRDCFNVLELGCGAGANIPFFRNLGVLYHGIEGSDYIVQQLKQEHPDLAEQIVCADFTQQIPFESKFDLIVDRSALTHNPTHAIEKCLSMLHSQLKPGGQFIGIDWFSTRCSQYKKGKAAEDAYTRTGYREGRFQGVGRVHFSDKKHIFTLFKNFSLRVLEEKVVRREAPKDKEIFAVWNLVAERQASK